MAICEILSVGTEILLGDILNTNAQFLSKKLAEMGISVFYHTSVGDNPKRLESAVKTALDRSDIVITTGGLGPTADDITTEICSKAFGFELEYNKEIAKQICDYFKRRGIEMSANNYKQAYIPKGGVVFDNLSGTAPGIGMKKEGKTLMLFPGPPYEMAPMFENFGRNFIKEYSTATIISHQIRTIGIGESQMAEICGDLLENENPTVAPYCKMGEAYLRVSAMAENQEKAEEIMKPFIDEIKTRLGDYIYGIDCNGIEFAVVELLKKHKLTVATAESCTGGFIAKRITDVPGASAIFKHGIVTYSNDVKEKAVGVNPLTLKTYGAVSEETAKEMARGIRRVAGSDIGISVTGFAGPASDEEGKAQGLIYVALDASDFSLCEKINTGRNDREYNRYVSASRALNLVRIYLLKEVNR